MSVRFWFGPETIGTIAWLAHNESLISIAKAREVLGYRPRYSWRKHVEGAAVDGTAGKPAAKSKK